MIPHKKRVAGFFGLLTLLLLASCIGYGASPVPGSVDFETIERGLQSGVHTSKAVVILGQTAWKRLWMVHKKTGASDATPPAVDFSKEMVIAVFLGERPTGGFSVRVTEISIPESAGGLSVSVEEVKPGKRCIVPMVITYPYQIVRLARNEGPVVFNQAIRVKDCSSRGSGFL
jgi:hypothetical protein